MTIELNPRTWRTKPYAHQVAGVRRLVTDPDFALLDEMGAGKSKQVVDAACALASDGQLRTVIVLTPANVRSVWLRHDENPDLDGEIHKHAWHSVGHRVVEFHSKRRGTHWREIWRHDWRDDGADRCANLAWVVTNYEFLRGEGMLARLVRAAEAGPTLLVCDESSFLFNHVSRQWKAVKELRGWCQRCVLLNGTPTNQNPLDLWGQFEVMDDRIFGKDFKNFYHFRWHFAEMLPQRHRGINHSKIIGWKNQAELHRLIAPHALRRLKRDCLDLPPKVYTTVEVPLARETWHRYVELRRDAIVSLPDDDTQVEPNAGVRLLRLAQLTSGHLGRTPGPPVAEPLLMETVVEAKVTDLSDEKLSWCVERLVADRAQGALPMVMVAQPQAGGLGISLTAASRVIYLSNTYSLLTRVQSEDRTDRPGPTATAAVVWCRWVRERERLAERLRAARFTVFEMYGAQPKGQREAAKAGFQAVATTTTASRSSLYVDVLATGPTGQRTVDHTVVRALREKAELARWTSRAWRRELESHETDD